MSKQVMKIQEGTFKDLLLNEKAIIKSQILYDSNYIKSILEDSGK